MINFEYVDSHLKAKGASASHPFDNDLHVYTYKGTRFAFVGKDSSPLRISLRVDEVLIKHLSDKYESVMPGHKLNPKQWVTILVTGQLTDQEILDLINRALDIAGNS